MNAVVPGALSSVVTCTLFYPLERVETLLQASAGGLKAGGRSVLVTCRTVYHSAGIPGFYQGLHASATGTLAYYGLYFHVNHVLDGRWPSRTLGAVAAKSWGAAALACLATTPLLVWRTWSMVHPRPVAALRAEVQRRGPRALYSGVLPNVLGTGSTALWFTSHHYLKQRVAGDAPTATVTPAMAGALGAVSTAIAATATYPFSVLRTKLIVDATVPTTMGAAARAILHSAGPTGFYRGFATYLLRTIPKGFTFFTVHQIVDDALSRPHRGAAAAAA